jgi:flagellin
MSISIQTNVASLMAQDNLATNALFQSKTIERLTSGYRINQSGDDAAGLGVANRYRSNIAELTQGVLNANDGSATLQIVDGGLSNISTMLDRLKTLATESATSTFTGDRTTLNTEYKNLSTEIDRQAQNIQLNQGGTYNANLAVYIGGATQSSGSNAFVNVDLSGQAVDSASLGLANTSISGGGNSITDSGSAPNLLTTANVLGSNEVQTFKVNYTNASGAATSSTITVNGAASGISVNSALNQMNSQLSGLGITASVNQTNGALQFSGSGAFSVNATGGAYTDGIFSNAGTVTADNKALYTASGAVGAASAGEVFTLTTASNQSVTISLTAADTTQAQTIADINKQSQALGITAGVDSSGNTQLTSAGAFTVVQTAAATVPASGVFATTGNLAVTAPTAATTATGNALTALSAIQNAVTALSTVQGKVGTGENKLQYAIDLANSQITNFSAAQSHIRDADVAAEAANLTKAQVLQQASIAAMAQANSAPQAVLKLLQG